MYNFTSILRKIISINKSENNQKRDAIASEQAVEKSIVNATEKEKTVEQTVNVWAA